VKRPHAVGILGKDLICHAEGPAAPAAELGIIALYAVESESGKRLAEKMVAVRVLITEVFIL